MAKPAFKKIRLNTRAVDVRPLPGGGMVLTSPCSIEPAAPTLGHLLERQAAVTPDRPFLRERPTRGGAWRESTYAETLRDVRGIAGSLIERNLGPARPVAVLSGNGLDHALVSFGCMHAGVPVAPISPAYSLMSEDHAKLRAIFNLLKPGLVFVDDGVAFERALRAVSLDDVEIVHGRSAPAGLPSRPITDLLRGGSATAVQTRLDGLGPQTTAKILFTSGSTGEPKGVINTQAMLTSNAEMFVRTWPFLLDRPPVLVDWLPWNHTFGGNVCVNLTLRSGGTLHIDGGKPLPGLIEQTVENLREIAPTVYFNVPAGYAALLPFLEQDRALRENFFSDVDFIFYGGAALSQDLWDRLERLSIETRGDRVVLASGWGSTETGPGAAVGHWPVEQTGVIGLPMPGVSLKLVPNGSKLEVRVQGPNVMPGYFERDDLTHEAFDEDGYYKIGDAVRLVDPSDPARGLLFDGRVAEDFKLVSGTWVHVGMLRVAALAAAAPALREAVVTGHDREFIGLLAWSDPAGCEKIGDAAELRRHLEKTLALHNSRQPPNARIRRVLLLDRPPRIDANEITDKGYVNQRATLEQRAERVEQLYAEPPDPQVIVIAASSR